jgi:hypothetical protein
MLSTLEPPPIPGSGAGNGGNNGSGCRSSDGPGAGVAAGPPTPPIFDALIPQPASPLPAPADAAAAADTRRRWQLREPVQLLRWDRSRRLQQREQAVAASGGGEIKTQWLTLFLSRTCKRGLIKQHATTSRISREPDRITSMINVRIKRDKIAGYKRIKM